MAASCRRMVRLARCTASTVKAAMIIRMPTTVTSSTKVKPCALADALPPLLSTRDP